MSTPAFRSTVLSVDGSPEVQDLIKEVLGHYFDLKFASHAADAERLAEEDPQPDVVLLDVVMPGRDGYETCRALKGNPNNARSS